MASKISLIEGLERTIHFYFPGRMTKWGLFCYSICFYPLIEAVPTTALNIPMKAIAVFQSLYFNFVERLTFFLVPYKSSRSQN